MFCYIKVHHDWMLPRTLFIFAFLVLVSDYLCFRRDCTPCCRPICYCMIPVTSCRIARWTTLILTFALSVTVLCPEHLTVNTMFCYIKLHHDWMLPRTLFVFTLSVLGFDYLHFRGGRTSSCRSICYCLAPIKCCRIVRQIVSMLTFAPLVIILCPDHLAENAMFCYIRVHHDWMLLRAPLASRNG
jgi:uncharacterized membrane protein SirB2